MDGDGMNIAVVNTKANKALAEAQKPVTPDRTTFLKQGKNLFNKNTALPGKFVSQNDGTLVDNAAYTVSDFIPVSPNTQYTMARFDGNQRIVYYNSNKTFISGVFASGATVKTPANCSYVRFSFTNTLDINKQQFEVGSTTTEYESFNVSIANLKTNLEANSVDSDHLNPKSVTKEKISFPIPAFQQTKNLFNKNSVTQGFFVSQSSGQLAASASHYVSDYIPVSATTQYSLNTDSNLRIAYYDINKNFISGAINPTTPVTTPANCVFVRFSYPTSISSDVVQFEQGSAITSYANYGYTSPELVASSSSSDTTIITLPSKLYALVGKELNIYFDNIVSGRDYDYDFDVVCGKGQQYQNFWRFVPDVAENRAITVNVYKNNKLVASASSTIVCKPAAVGSGVNKKIIKIGDSTTDNGNGIVKLNENFTADVMDITAIGTRGTNPNLHEGRSGWTATNYCTVASVSSVVNAFWNPTTSRFDFSYYISNNSLSTPDYVFINLGINDMFSFTDDAGLDTGMTSAISKFNEMITSIKAHNANIKVSLGLTIPPNYSQDAFGKAYGSAQNRIRYKRNHDLWVKKLIETYDKREAENIYVVPIHTNLDTRYNMGTEETQVNARNTKTYTSPIGNGGVHPVESGYWQIADVEWYFLKSFES